MIWSSPRRWSPSRQQFYKQFNKPTLTISHCPCKIKLDVSTLCFAYFTWLGAFVNRTDSYIRTYDHNNDQIVAIYVSLSGPPLKMQSQLKRERQTPASRISGTSRMSVVEPVSRKRTRKVGPGRFINSMPTTLASARERVTITESMPTFNMCSNRTSNTTHRSDLIPLMGFAAENNNFSNYRNTEN